jgi:hypothetical protein
MIVRRVISKTLFFIFCFIYFIVEYLIDKKGPASAILLRASYKISQVDHVNSTDQRDRPYSRGFETMPPVKYQWVRSN